MIEWLKSLFKKPDLALPKIEGIPSREDWQAGNLWIKCTGLLVGFVFAAGCVISLIVVIWWFVTKPLATAPAQTEPVAEVKAEPQKPNPSKAATKNVAIKAINTPATAKKDAEFPAMPIAVKSAKPSEPLTQFDHDLIEFERKIP